MTEIVCERCGAANAVPEKDAGEGVPEMKCAECGEAISAPESATASAGGARAIKAETDKAMIGERGEDSPPFNANTLRKTADKSETAVEDSGIVDVAKLLSAARATGRDSRPEVGDGSALLGVKRPAVGSLSVSPDDADKEEKGGKTLYAILGAGMFIGAAILGAAWILKPQLQPIAGLEQNPGTEQATVAGPVAVEPDEKQAGPSDLEQQPTAEERADRDEAKEEAERPRRGYGERDPASSENGRGKKRSLRADKTESAPAAEPASAEKTAAPPESEPGATAKTAPSSGTGPEAKKAQEKEPSANRSLASLLDNAVVAGAPVGATKTAATAQPARDLPQKPSRDQVLDALRRVQSKVSACAGGKKGTAMAAIKVASSGKVKSVNISNVEEPAASCIAGAVKLAKFPEFSDDEFSINFPFHL